MTAYAYPVTTLGELGELDELEGELEEASAPMCGCGSPGASVVRAPAAPPQMGSLEDLWLLYNPFVWAAQRMIGAASDRATGTDSSAEPGGFDRLAAALGVDPVEYAIELTGYTGLGRYWPAMQVIGGAVAVGGAALLAKHALERRKKKKGKRG